MNPNKTLWATSSISSSPALQQTKTRTERFDTNAKASRHGSPVSKRPGYCTLHQPSFFLSYASEMSEIIRDAHKINPLQNQNISILVHHHVNQENVLLRLSSTIVFVPKWNFWCLTRHQGRDDNKKQHWQPINNTFEGILMTNAELLRHRCISKNDPQSRR